TRAKSSTEIRHPCRLRVVEGRASARPYHGRSGGHGSSTARRYGAAEAAPSRRGSALISVLQIHRRVAEGAGRGDEARPEPLLADRQGRTGNELALRVG